MHTGRQILTVFLLCLCTLDAFSQRRRHQQEGESDADYMGSHRARRGLYKDSLYHVPIVGVSLSGELPYADMGKRFGSNIAAGMPVVYKTGKNLLMGVEGSYFFSGNVRENPLSYMYTPSGTITDANGNPGRLRLNERGFTVYGLFGKVFNQLGSNKNSGLMTWLGFGYMQHKIHIYDVGRNLAQVNGALSKGYDRLSGGFAMEQFIGYMYLSKNRLVNCYFGIEVQEGFTRGLRGYQYDTGMPDNQKRLDILVGLRVGWLLPIYKKAPKEFYYY